LSLRLSHEQLAKGLQVKLGEYEGRYDLVRKCWVFPVAPDFAIVLPLVITGGDTITINSIDDLFRHAVKYDSAAPSLCTCVQQRAVGVRTPAARHNTCEECSFRPDPEKVVVQRSLGGGTCSLEDALLLSERRTALLELLLTLVCSHEKWPHYFVAGRPDPPAGAELPHRAGRSAAYREPQKSGVLAGANFAFGMLCTAPDCTACAWVCASEAAPHQLEVRFMGEHCHPAQACKDCGVPGCESCPEYNMLPVAAPYGRLRGLLGAVQLARVAPCVKGLDAGASDSATALFRGGASSVPPAELLCGNRSRNGVNADNWGAALREERERKSARHGVLPVPAPQQGGPQTFVGRVAEQLVRAVWARACAATRFGALKAASHTRARTRMLLGLADDSAARAGRWPAEPRHVRQVRAQAWALAHLRRHQLAHARAAGGGGDARGRGPVCGRHRRPRQLTLRQRARLLPPACSCRAARVLSPDAPPPRLPRAAQFRELALVTRVPGSGARDVAVLISNDLSEQNIYEFYNSFRERLKITTGAVTCVEGSARVCGARRARAEATRAAGTAGVARPRAGGRAHDGRRQRHHPRAAPRRHGRHATVAVRRLPGGPHGGAAGAARGERAPRRRSARQPPVVSAAHHWPERAQGCAHMCVCLHA
jgi:hypothetical protein